MAPVVGADAHSTGRDDSGVGEVLGKPQRSIRLASAWVGVERRQRPL